MPRASDLFIVAIASPDNRAVARSVATLVTVSQLLNRPFMLNVQSGTGITNARTMGLEALRKQFPQDKEAYLFWLDSDITIDESPQAIADLIREAERLGVSFTASYHVVDNASKQTWSVVGKKYPYHYTDEELSRARPFELKCEYSGLGLCYKKTPLDYRFRMEGHDLEDLFFFRDNPGIDMRYAPIANRHMKAMYI